VRGRVLPALIVVAAVGAAVVLALLGRAVLSVPTKLDAEDVRLARPELAAGVEIGPSGAFGGAAEALVGATDDQSYREALRLYRASRAERSDVDVLALHGAAAGILTRLVRDDGDPKLRARAANLLGVMLLQDAHINSVSARRYLELSLGAFQDAARLDPEHAEAKHNLELLATLPPGRTFREEPQQGSEVDVTPPSTGGY
jgi:hypothetical protein